MVLSLFAYGLLQCLNRFLQTQDTLSPLCAKTWTGFSKEALHDIPSFLSLLNNSLEMWSSAIMVLLSCLLPNPKLETSVLSICRSSQLEYRRNYLDGPLWL